jgi:hypothetical protein
MIGDQKRMGRLGPVRESHSINAAPKPQQPTRFDPAVQLPPQSSSGTASRQEKRRGKNRPVSRNRQNLAPFHSNKMTYLSTKCNKKNSLGLGVPLRMQCTSIVCYISSRGKVVFYLDLHFSDPDAI